MSRYPQPIRELGYEYRRKAGIKYVELPQLWDELRCARKAWLEYQKWFEKYAKQVPQLSINLIEVLENNFRNSWLRYFGPDAEAELLTMYEKHILELEKEMIALILIEYDAPDISTYRCTRVITDRTEVFATEDPCKDYNDALRYAQKHQDVDEIVQHDSCLMFMLQSKGKYNFNLKEEMVRVERE